MVAVRSRTCVLSIYQAVASKCKLMERFRFESVLSEVAGQAEKSKRGDHGILRGNTELNDPLCRRGEGGPSGVGVASGWLC